MTMGDEIFVTGMLRSGTTLLEKLLAQQPRISMLSQPFPLLYVEAKRSFLRQLGSGDDPYPLGHLFRERRYTAGDLARYLSQWTPSREELAAIFARMETYSGQLTRFSRDRLEATLDSVAGTSGFAEIVSRLLHLLAARPDARWFGAKETACEELVPVLLDHGFRCLIIIRDPRDVVTSLNHGTGHEMGGDVRPTLFNIRAWRKSVAIAHTCTARERFHWCRYEDLVADPERTLRAAASQIDVDLDTFDFTTLRDPSGGAWTGNSSHRTYSGISRDSVGTHRTLLPPEVGRFIEAACLPELQRLGYPTTLTRADAVRALHDFREPYTITRPGMENDFATEQNRAIEVDRLNEHFDGR